MSFHTSILVLSFVSSVLMLFTCVCEFSGKLERGLGMGVVGQALRIRCQSEFERAF